MRISNYNDRKTGLHESKRQSTGGIVVLYEPLTTATKVRYWFWAVI